MYDFGVCPRCQMEIASERLQASPIVCNHCGFTGDRNEKIRERKLEKRKQSLMYTISAGLVAVFIGLVIWDSHILTAVPIQAKKLVGMASPNDFQSLNEICKKRGNLECQINALKELSKSHNEANAQLGKIYLLSKKFQDAETTLQKYFREGGISLDASYDYARALEELGNVEMASRYYQAILDKKPDTLQITVTKRYIKMLLDYNRKSEAKKVLASIRKKGSNTADFMETVFENL